MDFYISWSHSDAIFCEYYADCPMLISAVPDNTKPLKKFKKLPSKLIVDSGALYYSDQIGYRLKDIFYKQLDIVADAPPNLQIKMVHFDRPIKNNSTLSIQYESMERSLYNAYEYISLFQKEKLTNNISILGVIQGYDIPSIRYSTYELVKMGYTFFGIGSLVGKNIHQQLSFIKEVSSIVGPQNLHIFGVTGIPQIKSMIKLGIASIDSSRPTMAAAFFQVFYSDPFRSYFLSKSRVKDRNLKIESPLECDCPVCLSNAADILIPSPREFMKLRSVHNYYHLLKTINQIKKEVLR